MIQPPIPVKQGLTFIVASMLIYICYIWLSIESLQDIQNLTSYVVAVYIALNVFIAFLLLKIWQGKNWAKWLLFIWFLISIGFLVITSVIFGFEYSTDILVEIGTMLIEAIGWYKLFSKNAASWFKTNAITALTHHSSGTDNIAVLNRYSHPLIRSLGVLKSCQCRDR